jgi:hypothetical protein
MGRYAYRQQRSERGRPGCRNALFALIFVGCLAVLVYAFAVRPLLTRAVADELAGAPVPTLIPAQPVQPQAATAVAGQADAVLPTALAALPAGELVVTEDEVNSFIASRPDAIQPLDSLSLRFTPGNVVAQISAYGVSSGATIGLAAQDGQVVVTSATVDAPLSYVLSGPDLARALADRLNAELTAQNRRVDDLRVEEGRLVLVTS